MRRFTPGPVPSAGARAEPSLGRPGGRQMTSDHIQLTAVERAIEYLTGIKGRVRDFRKLAIELSPGAGYPAIAMVTNPGSFPEKPEERAG